MSLRTTGGMKTPVELAISQMQALHIQQRCVGSYQIKVRPSHVEETLFGSPAGTQPIPPDFDILEEEGQQNQRSGDRCHRHQGPRGAVSTPPPVAAPQPSPKEEQIQTDQADPFLLR